MSTQPSAGPVALRLSRMEHPAHGRTITVFETAEAASAHVRDHVLSNPESEAWRLVWPPLEEVADFDRADARWQLLRAAESDGGASLQPVYDAYAAAIRAEVGDAVQLNWRATRDRVTACLGTGGVVSLFDPVLRTAMVPGFGSAERTQRSHQELGGLARMVRHQPMREVRRARRDPRPDRQRRHHQRDRDQRRYFEVFRPAVQSVRRHHHQALNMYGEPRRNDMALLKEVLPRQSQLKLDAWQELRRRCRGS